MCGCAVWLWLFWVGCELMFVGGFVFVGCGSWLLLNCFVFLGGGVVDGFVVGVGFGGFVLFGG